MKKYPDCVDIRTLRIVGTHDSYAYNQGPFVETQEWNVPTQLAHGIRFLDIRIGSKRDLEIYHGPVSLGKTWAKDVIPELRAFLEANPSEVVLLRVKDETESETELKLPLPAFMVLEKTLVLYELREMRGKAVILNDIESHALDEYQIAPFGVSIREKKAHILQRMHRISDRKEWNFIFLSGTLGMQPGAVAEKVNKAVEEDLKKSKESFGYFVIVLDYPTVGFIRAVQGVHE